MKDLLDFCRALREMGALNVVIGDVSVVFAPQETKSTTVAPLPTKQVRQLDLPHVAPASDRASILKAIVDDQ